MSEGRVLPAAGEGVAARPRPARARRAVGPPFGAAAWVTIGSTAAFVLLTAWWLTQDRSVPIFDAGNHLDVALRFHQMLSSGDLLGPFNFAWQYPPLGGLVGALSIFVGGVNVAAPIIGENVVFASLLSLGCYQVGRVLFDARAGMLASVFALGSPLLISLFHVFLLEPAETALVAISLWLILASEQFGRPRISAAAGLACGLGLLVKVQFPFFVIGAVAAAVLAGGWRNRRGMELFAVVALVVGAPWYIRHRPELSTILTLGGSGSKAVPGNLPPTWSLRDFSWYFWSILNSQLLAFLFAFLLVGAVWMIAVQVRCRGEGGSRGLMAQRELLWGAFVAWLGITLTPHHDIRYDLPLLPYLAVIATGWISALPRAGRLLAGGALGLVVIGNTLGTTFGVGRSEVIALADPPPATEALPDRIVLYASGGFMAGAPRREGDVPGLLRALRHNGVREIMLRTSEGEQPDFSYEGMIPLAMIAHLSSRLETLESGDPSSEPFDSRAVSSSAVALIHRQLAHDQAPPCTRLGDQTGVWVIRRDPVGNSLALYCPSRHPSYYGAVSPTGAPLA